MVSRARQPQRWAAATGQDGRGASCPKGPEATPWPACLAMVDAAMAPECLRCSVTLTELPTGKPLTQAGLGVSPYGFQLCQERLLCRCCPGAVLTVPAAPLTGHSSGPEEGRQEQLLCTSLEPVTRAAWKILSGQGSVPAPRGHRALWRLLPPLQHDHPDTRAFRK